MLVRCDCVMNALLYISVDRWWTVGAILSIVYVSSPFPTLNFRFLFLKVKLQICYFEVEMLGTQKSSVWLLVSYT